LGSVLPVRLYICTHWHIINHAQPKFGTTFSVQSSPFKVVSDIAQLFSRARLPTVYYVHTARLDYISMCILPFHLVTILISSSQLAISFTKGVDKSHGSAIMLCDRYYYSLAMAERMTVFARDRYQAVISRHSP